MSDSYVPHELPWFPVVQTFPIKPEIERFALNKAEVLAIKALFAGNANSYQQQMGIKAITERISGAHDMTFRPGDDGGRASAFAEGRRFVGLMIIRAINLPFKPSGDNPNARASDSASGDAPGARPKPPGARPKPGTRDPGSETA